MPQLSPLNWIVLFILFWFAFFSMFVMIWWYYKPIFLSMKELGEPMLEEKYRWMWK